MISPTAALTAAILEHPDEYVPWLEYADVLDDRVARVHTREVVEAVIGDGPAESRSGSGHTPSIV